jgi:predicted nucleic acid-binding protein
VSHPTIRAIVPLDGRRGDADAFIAEITVGAIRIETQPGPKAPDPGDQMLWDLLSSRDDLQLVTGDRLLLKNSRMRGRVVTPEAFAVAWLRLDA